MAGSDVSDAIDKDSGRMYSAGHAFCKAVDDAEGDITISVRWSVQGLCKDD